MDVLTSEKNVKESIMKQNTLTTIFASTHHCQSLLVATGKQGRKAGLLFIEHLLRTHIILGTSLTQS